jgi:hypothetical protein
MVKLVNWDKGVEFESTYRRILRHLQANNKITKCYDAILLTQVT